MYYISVTEVVEKMWWPKYRKLLNLLSCFKGVTVAQLLLACSVFNNLLLL